MSSPPAPDFVSVPNMRRLIAVLDSHFTGNLGIDIAGLGVPLKQFLHRVMTSVKNDYGAAHNIHDLNKLAVKIAKDFLMQVAKSQYESERFAKKLDLVTPVARPAPGQTAAVEPFAETAEPGEEMLRRIKAYEEERGKLSVAVAGDGPGGDVGGGGDAKVLPSHPPGQFPDPMDVSIGNPYVDYSFAVEAAFARDGTAARVLNPRSAHLVDQNRPGAANPPEPGAGAAFGGSSSFDTIIPRSEKKRVVDRYLMINGFNRDFAIHKSRFEFQVNLNTNDATFSDIRSISAVKLIIPREIMEERTITNVPNTNFNHRFGLRHQYLILQIEEFQNVYRSPSLPSSKAFAHFVFDSSHKSPFGRDYVTLCSVMHEELRFDTNVYTQLSSMTLSVRQPSGALLNTSRDDYRLFKMDYDATNSRYMNVRLGRYFSKNEFFVGDVVRFTGFRARYFVGPDPEDYASPPGAADLEAFVNREAGHDILEVIDATASGYYSSFYIQAPGEFDPATGLFDVRLDLVDGDPMRAPQSVLYEVNQNTTFPASLAAPDARLFEVGKCVNLSLQIAVAFKIKVEEDDVTV